MRKYAAGRSVLDMARGYPSWLQMSRKHQSFGENVAQWLDVSMVLGQVNKWI